MSPEDRSFILQLVGTVLLAIVGYFVKQNQEKTDALDTKVVENHKQTNSRMDEYLKTAEEKYILIGVERGRILEKEDEIVRQTALAAAATTAALLQMAQAIPATTPSVTAAVVAPVPVEIVQNPDTPVPVVMHSTGDK